MNPNETILFMSSFAQFGMALASLNVSCIGEGIGLLSNEVALAIIEAISALVMTARKVRQNTD